MKDKKMYILLVISILFAVIGISLAFFSLNIIGNDTAKYNKITTGDLELVFTDDNEVSLDGAFPGDSITKTISVKNTGTKEVSYNIVWQELLNEITNNELVIDGTCKNLNSSNAEDGECSAISKKAVKEGNVTSNIPIKPGYTQEYEVKITFIDTGKPQNYNKNKSFKGKLGLTESSAKIIYCTYDGELTQGAEYVNGQYTYRYMQEGKSSSAGLGWINISTDGWGVQLTDKTSTAPVTTNLCTYINDKPVVSMARMFYDSQTTEIDVSGFNTSNIINMEGLFLASKVSSLDLSSFDTSKVTNMAQMFQELSVNSLELSTFDTSKVTNMIQMFCSIKVTMLDLSSFDTSNVTNMANMFFESKATTINLSSFGTSNVINMSGMFYGSQVTTIDVSNFDTSNVTNMNSMFYSSQVTTLDLSNFDTSKVTDMRWMFKDNQATTINLSSFDTSNVTDMKSMFDRAANLKAIYASDKFITDNVISSDNMFYGCTNLIGGAGTAYDSTKIDKTYAHIDGGTSNPGYFTDIADKPSSFSTDDWTTIINSVKSGNSRGYKVGDTKEIDLGTTYGAHTLRIANMSTPSECNTQGFSQTACGFVLEFADIITKHKMNDTNTNVGGWPATTMRTFVNNDIYNVLPNDLRNVIIDTVTVSGHGSEDTENFTSTDKLYLLSPKEIYTNFSSSLDSAKDLTRTLDYYTNIGVTTSNYSGAAKKGGTSGSYYWSLRSAYSYVGDGFYRVDYGDGESMPASVELGVSPAFRLG